MSETINEGIDGEVVAYVRDAARSVSGGNYTFAIDDIDVMCLLAQRAVDAGLAEGVLHGSVLRKAQTLSLARAFVAFGKGTPHARSEGEAAQSDADGSPQTDCMERD